MPSLVVKGAQLAANLKSNHHHKWGKADSGQPSDACHRLHKRELNIWRPRTDVKVDQGAAIFAMGSCFARRIETVFMERGFPVLSRPIEQPGLGIDIAESSLTNRFNTASMLLEFRRILESPEALPDDALQIIEKGGRVIDGHYHNVYAGTPQELIERRQRFYSEFQSVRQADIIILTLGLTEAPFDPVCGLYRNVSPTPREIARQKDIEIHVLNFRENMENLEAIYALLKKNCVRDPKIFVTVSPVPLGGTFQLDDVIVANSASKSTLRTVAFEFTSSHQDVIYFPSYEIATNVDPIGNWRDDMRHVTHPLVQSIIRQFEAAHIEPRQAILPQAAE